MNATSNRLSAKFLAILREAALTCWELAKIMVPVSIATRVLTELGVVDWLGVALAPLMGLLDLPGEIGLVWATAMVTNLYGGMAIFAALAPELELTVAQATVTSLLMLTAHSLPIELRVAQKAGARLLPMFLVRFLGAIAMAGIMLLVYRWGGWLQSANRTILRPIDADIGWGAWALKTGQNLLLIFCVILTLLVLMRLLNRLGIIRVMTRFLEPVLETMGMSQDVAPLTIIGITMGLSYGGGLIIRESQAGHLRSRDIVYSLASMGICHALIEDTFLMMAIGGHMSGVFWGRLALTLLFMAVIVRATRRIPNERFERLFFRAQR